MHGDCQCARNSTDTSISPTFLCAFNVTIKRLPECSTQVKETIVFPHNTGSTWYHNVPFNSGGNIKQDSIVVRREENTTAYLFDARQRKITVPTSKSELPVKYEIIYQVEDSITKLVGGDCKFSNFNLSNDGPRNYLLWSLGSWDKTVDALNVRFSTNDTTAKLQFANEQDGDEEGQDISVTRTDLEEEIHFFMSVHVLESGTDFCSREWRCPSISPQPTEDSGGIIPIIVGISGTLALLGLCCYFFCSGKSRALNSGGRGRFSGGFSGGGGGDGGGGGGGDDGGGGGG